MKVICDVWIILPRSKSFINKNPGARSGKLPFDLFIREGSESPKTMEADAVALENTEFQIISGYFLER